MSGVLERTIRGGLGFLGANAATRVLGFLFVVVAGRLLGPAGFGVLSLALSVAGLVRRLAEFGLPDTIVRFLAGEGEEDAPELLGTALSVGAALAVVGAAALAVLAPWLSRHAFSEPRLADPLRLLAAAVLLWVPLSLGRSVLQARERVPEIVGVDLVQHGARVAAVALALLLVGGVSVAAAAVAASVLLPLALVATRVKALPAAPDPGLLREKLGRVVELAAPLLVVGFSYTLAKYADRILLGALAGSADVGVYTVAATLAMATLVIHGSLVSIFKPVIADVHREGRMEEGRSAYLLVSKWAAAASGGLLLVFCAFGPELLDLFGEGYASAPAHAALLLLTSLFFVGNWIGPTGAVLQMTGGERLELLNTGVFVTVNVGLNVLLIPRFGVVGAAAATLASGLARNLMQVWQLVRLYRFVPVEVHRVGLLGGTALAAAAILGVRPDPWPSGLLLAAALAGLAWYLLATLTETERDYVARLRGRLLEGGGASS